MLKLTIRSVEDLASAATVAFHKTLIDKVDWICGNCWASAVEGRIKEINEASAAYNLFTSAKQKAIGTFDDDEIQQIMKLITPMKHLEMRQEMKELMIEALKEKGVDPLIFTKVKGK